MFDYIPKNAWHVLLLTSDIRKSHFFSNFEPRPAILIQEYTATKIILDQEIRPINTNYLKLGNMSVTKIYFSLPKMPKPGKLSVIKDLLMIWYYWFHLQKRVFIIAKSLIALDLLSYEAIYTLMNFCQPISLIIPIMKRLSYFQYLKQATSYNNLGFGIIFTTLVIWLSIVIVCLCTNWNRILNFLTMFPFLGQLQLEWV